MDLLIYIGIVLTTFIGMEGVAWLTHKYIMHGIFWFLHRDHHHKDHYGFFERNDFFFLIFALPGIACLATGTIYHLAACTSIGIGITLYGACYFFVHDLFIHQRVKVLRNSENWYLKAIRRAHKMHHKHTGKYDGESFGMLWVSRKYFRNNQKSK
ncbi:sterol desaturase family protein [uncultured Mucilaginibacter sp.]|uniref:sterol desaturase family protein n=1 Tax=uncultured Mucilaginibacter sp. TaxID=797541 RepID=UPI0025DB5FF6|nr:sterol desaturase family protein [uncultured Mucilaginibacter sp.]